MLPVWPLRAAKRWRRPLTTILILTFGSRGDVQSYVALGAALAARGHDVSLSTGQGFDDLITAHGVSSAPISLDVQAMMNKPEVLAAMKSPRAWIKAFRATQDLMQRQFDEMWSVTQEVAPQIIVYHPKAFIAPYLARALGAVAVPSFLQPAYVATGAFPNPLVRLPSLGRVGNRLSGRAMVALMRLGYSTLLRRWTPRHKEVASHPRLDPLSGYHAKGAAVPRLHAHSAHIVPKPEDWGSHDHVTGYWFFGSETPWKPPADLEAFLAAGSPPVYVGFGSMPDLDAGRVASVVLSALRRTKTRAVVAKGWGALGDATANEHVHVVDSAPHDWLFPRCRAVVHHGGAGTTHEGLRWGRPTLVCPVFGDQPFWGRRVAACGAGPDPIPLRRLDEDRLADALRALRSDAVQHQTDSLGERIRSERGAEAAADLIEMV